MAKSDRIFYCCCSTKGLIITGSLLFFPFFLIGVVSNAAAALVYRAQVVPGFTYDTPKPELLACHWLATIFGMLMGISFWIAVRHPIIGFSVLVTSAVLLFGTYLACVLVFFLNGDYTAKVPTMDINGALQMFEDAKTKNPWYALYGTGYRIEKVIVNGTVRERITHCRTAHMYLPVESSIDATEDVGLDVRDFQKVVGLKVKTGVDVTLTPESDSMDSDLRSKVKGCYTRSPFTVSIHTDVGIYGMPEEVLVTRDGQGVSCISTGHAIASGIFLSGATYAYRLATLASLSAKVVKTNVSLKPYEGGDVCERIGVCRVI